MPNIKKETEKNIIKSIKNLYKYSQIYMSLSSLHSVMDIVLNKMEIPEYKEYLFYSKMHNLESIEPHIKFEENSDGFIINYNKAIFKVNDLSKTSDDLEVTFPLSFFINQNNFLESSKIIYKTTEKSLSFIENLSAMANEEVKPTEEDINLFFYLNKKNMMACSLLLSFLPLENIIHILELKQKKYKIDDFLLDQLELEKILVSKTMFDKNKKRTMSLPQVGKFISQMKEKYEAMLVMNKSNEIETITAKGYKQYKL